jgi:hypothetical protein
MMGYFKYTGVSSKDYQEWNAVVGQIRAWPEDDKYRGYRQPLPVGISHHLEAKALYVFTMARRWVRAVYLLARATRDWVESGGNVLPDGEEWKSVFVETTSLLFPMIELVGHARLDDREATTAYKRNEVPVVANLWAGLHWLRDPKWLPQVKNDHLKGDGRKLDRWEIGHLTFLRNYFLHGSKDPGDSQGGPAPAAGIMSYELPIVLAREAEKAMPVYWGQLKQDDGTQKWVERLARADIRPFQIQGSGVFEAGLVDPDIVDYLDGHVDIKTC